MNIRTTIPFWVCPLLLLLAGACTPLATTPDSGSEEPLAEAVSEDGESGDAELEKLVGQATADLAERLSVTAGEIERLRAERVTWRDSSLGCPQPGMMYMQALQPGVLIELRAGGAAYRYHSKPEGPAVYCEKPSKKDPLPAE